MESGPFVTDAFDALWRISFPSQGARAGVTTPKYAGHDIVEAEGVLRQAR